MRTFAIACLVAVSVAACSDGNDATKILAAVAPPVTAPERSTMPGKCKDSLTFDQECSELFDKAFGNGVGSAERVRLINDRAYSGGNAYKPSTAKPAPKLGL
jgi:hypothetical protein